MPAQTTAAKRAPTRDQNRIVVAINDYGGASPGIVANDGLTPGPRSKFRGAGLEVEFKVILSARERAEALDAGEVDAMMVSLDYFANLVPLYRDKGVALKAFMMADWSRGNLGIVTTPGVRSIEGLKGAKIATTRGTPTHFFLIDLLERSNLSEGDIDRVKSSLVFATTTPQAGEMFQRGEVDAVAIWEPHLSQAVAKGKGRLLVSTATATNLVADLLFARADYLAMHEADVTKFVRVWLEGAYLVDHDPSGSAATLAKAFKRSEDEARGVLATIKPAAFADNRAFFGLDREDSPYVTLFDEASKVWRAEGVIMTASPAAPTRWLKALEALSSEHVNEQIVEHFSFAGGPKQGVSPLLTKSVSVYFPSGSDRLDPNAKKVVDLFAQTVAEFGNAYVRIEGNTDTTGAREANVALSKRRADALVDYLQASHGFDRKRFTSVGNGPDKPLGDNATPEGRERNRRTDFQIIPNY